VKRFKISLEVMVDVTVEAETRTEAIEKAMQEVGTLHGDSVGKDVTVLTDAPINPEVLSEDDVEEPYLPSRHHSTYLAGPS